MKFNPLPMDVLPELYVYNPWTGKLYFKQRGIEFFKTPLRVNAWNARWAGREAFTCVQPENGYLVGNILAKPYVAHRVAWALHTGEEPEFEIDHWDGVRTNNVFSNFRPATHAQNMQNRFKKSGFTSQYLGVYWDKKDRRWKAQGKKNGKQTLILSCGCEIEAAKAYDAFALEHYGEFANLNFGGSIA